MAFLHAMISAAIVVTLTRNCSLGHFDTCGCDKTKTGAVGKYLTRDFLFLEEAKLY